MVSYKVNYFIDVLLAISALLVISTGLIKFPGLIPTLGLSYSNLPMGTLSRIHDWAGIALTILVIIHLVLHWNWIKATTKQIFKS
ncbi:hypothetical protein CL616_00140 [archaeon]|nr:hypothetical protein [archaeon]